MTEREWHMTGCVIAECTGAQRIDGLVQGGCTPCHCGHTLERHYQDREDEGCIACNAASITATRCPRFRSVMTKGYADD